mmetsp:Transcript_32111/g.73409  ORF Transcript_32111/g.73409 Transcript_32111/m.73409 type:complete len:556 (-) Transcript_32111:83-1750(-)
MLPFGAPLVLLRRLGRGVRSCLGCRCRRGILSDESDDEGDRCDEEEEDDHCRDPQPGNCVRREQRHLELSGEECDDLLAERLGARGATGRGLRGGGLVVRGGGDSGLLGDPGGEGRVVAVARRVPLGRGPVTLEEHEGGESGDAESLGDVVGSRVDLGDCDLVARPRERLAEVLPDWDEVLAVSAPRRVRLEQHPLAGLGHKGLERVADDHLDGGGVIRGSILGLEERLQRPRLVVRHELLDRGWGDVAVHPETEPRLAVLDQELGEVRGSLAHAKVVKRLREVRRAEDPRDHLLVVRLGDGLEEVDLLARARGREHEQVRHRVVLEKDLERLLIALLHGHRHRAAVLEHKRLERVRLALLAGERNHLLVEVPDHRDGAGLGAELFPHRLVSRVDPLARVAHRRRDLLPPLGFSASQEHDHPLVRHKLLRLIRSRHLLRSRTSALLQVANDAVGVAGSLKLGRFLLAVLEDVDCRESLDAEALAEGLVDRRVDGREGDRDPRGGVALERHGSLLPLGRELLAVSTPRREELDDQERVLLESIVEVLSRQLEDLLR